MSLALYRKYRPGSFAQVIGQEHVTGPLTRALETNRIHHAYLFTGPRGCGKTSSARIMARSLNCAQGPTANPCGTCQSCVDLAPNGPGSIDVIEIDAATYRGIDDAKELRDHAIYAPVNSQFKIYIIDEAHQLTRDAFNVLLKLVEEPPPHLKFIFATTEPDKIIPTLRSRTHHYPFRLVSARVLQEHLQLLCESEGIAADPAALALVARAGAGSVRDSQSVLGQVIAGAGLEGITYSETVAQLGFTDETLLTRVVDAIAAGNGAEIFTLIDEVVAAGHEPRRFATDLLERLRDMVIVTHIADSQTSGIFDLPQEQIADIARQAALFTPAQLVRVADLVNDGLSALRGAAAPRLQLELLAARLVTDEVTTDLAQRVTQLEQGGVVQSVRPSVVAAREQAKAQAAPEPSKPAEPGTVASPEPQVQIVASPPVRPTATARRTPPPAKPSQVKATVPETSAAQPEPATEAMPTSVTIEVVAANWERILQDVTATRKVAGLVLIGTQPLSLTSDGMLAVGFPNDGACKNFTGSATVGLLQNSIKKFVGAMLRIDAFVDASLNQKLTEKKTQSAPEVEAELDSESESVSTDPIDMVTSMLGAQVISDSSKNS
ncbi:MAG: DNA polymerase III subunit gamma and tau [Actinobacteria bacterium]|nr:DNA polymerase III subunit gamma and tau [Actinomycetota bacterium]